MSSTAHNLKAGNYVFHNGMVFQVLEVHQCRVGNGSSVKVTIVNPVSHHKTTTEFAHDHHVRTLEATNRRYQIQFISDIGEELEVSLLDRDTDEPHDFTVTNDFLISFLREHYNESGLIGDKPLICMLTSITVEPLHRVDSEINLEFMSKLEGFDFDHLHDRHHGKHHVH